jgi:hypothetical protein
MKELLEITPEMLDELKFKSRAATPGPWKLYKQSSEDRGNSYGVKVPAPVHWIVPPLNIPCENAAHIAAANPAVILALLAEIERLNQRYDDLLKAKGHGRHD